VILTSAAFLDLIKKLQFTYVQATGEAFNPQNRTSSTSKRKTSPLKSKETVPLKKIVLNLRGLLHDEDGRLEGGQQPPVYRRSCNIDKDVGSGSHVGSMNSFVGSGIFFP
jgi:hypothetical protein